MPRPPTPSASGPDSLRPGASEPDSFRPDASESDSLRPGASGSDPLTSGAHDSDSLTLGTPESDSLTSGAHGLSDHGSGDHGPSAPIPADDPPPASLGRPGEAVGPSPDPGRSGQGGFWNQAGRFLVVGLIAAGVDFTTMLILVAAGLSPVPAKAVSWVAGTATAYIGNRRWTFQGDPSARRLLAVIGLYGLTFGLQVALFAWLYSWLVGLWDQWLAQLAAFVVAQAVATATNFMVQRHLIFRHR